MSSPENPEHGTIWLGTPDTSAVDGIYPVQGPVRASRLGVFDRKLTIGDATKDSDDFISSWVVSNLSGGGQIENINEGSDTSRFWDGTAETRFAGMVTTPPKIDVTGLGANVYPVGESGGNFWVSVYRTLKNVDGAGLATGGNLITAGTALTNEPGGPGTPFQGTAANELLFIPWYTNAGGFAAGYSTARGQTGSCTVTNYTATAYDGNYENGSPGATSFKVLDQTLYAIDGLGILWYTTNTTTWNVQMNEYGDSPLKLPAGQVPKRLEIFYWTDGSPALHCVTDSNLYMFNQFASRWELTNLQFPPHPYFGKASCVWRPGEDLWVSAGMDCVRLTAAGVIVPLVGLSRDDGVPWNYNGYIKQFIPEASHLYALVEGGTASVTPVYTNRSYTTNATVGAPQTVGTTSQQMHSMYAWTGLGWHRLWEAQAAGATATLTYAMIDGRANNYRLYWGSGNNLCSIALRRSFHNPKQGWMSGVDQFASVGFFETGKFDANMRGFNKLASHVTVFMENANANATATISYRTDITMAAYQAAPLTATEWVELGEVSATGTTILNFAEETVTGYTGQFSRGVDFNWIQFRVLFELTDADDPPIMEHFVFHYTKIPQDTSSFIFEVPLPPDTFMGRTSKKMADDLAALIEANQFCIFKHKGNQYRVRVAGVAGSEPVGDEGGGVRQVNLIEIEQGA